MLLQEHGEGDSEKGKVENEKTCKDQLGNKGEIEVELTGREAKKVQLIEEVYIKIAKKWGESRNKNPSHLVWQDLRSSKKNGYYRVTHNNVSIMVYFFKTWSVSNIIIYIGLVINDTEICEIFVGYHLFYFGSLCFIYLPSKFLLSNSNV